MTRTGTGVDCYQRVDQSIPHRIKKCCVEQNAVAKNRNVQFYVSIDAHKIAVSASDFEKSIFFIVHLFILISTITAVYAI